MAGDLRKCIALGPDGLHTQSAYSYPNQRNFIIDTQTKWVRFWADWETLQPNPSGAFDHPKWLELDSQLRQVRNENPSILVVVTAYRFPRWTNAQRRGRLGIGDNHSDALFTVPDHLGKFIPGTGTRTPWSQFIEHLIIRYNPGNPGNNGAWAHCVEICNEPNIQMWPQQQTGVDAAIHVHTAQMMRTAKQIKDDSGLSNFWPVLLAPGTGDTTQAPPEFPHRTPYSTFTTTLINELGTWEAGGWFGWSHHNHRDIELDAGSGSTWPGGATNRAQHARQLIKGKWKGWGSPTDANNPKIFLTEGGGNLRAIRRDWFNNGGSYNELRDKQAWLLQRNYDRMKSDTGDGAGMSMLAHYLVTSHWTYDTGLRQAYDYANQGYLY